MYWSCRWNSFAYVWPRIQEAGFTIKTLIVWDKMNHSAGDLEGCFGNRWEGFIFAVKGRHLLRGKRYSNVWRIPRLSHTKMLHPAQRPVELIERMILASSDEGDRVLDPFGGSGTTGQAAWNKGRKFTLIEMEPSTCLVARRRLNFPIDPGELQQRWKESVKLRWNWDRPEDWGVAPEDVAELVAHIRNSRKELFRFKKADEGY